MHRFRLGFAIVSIAVAGLSFCAAGEPNDREKEIESLVKTLVSPNKEPQIKAGDADYPAGFDKAAQAHVCKAWKRLYDLGRPAIPFLIERLDDERYSFTAEDRLEGYSDNYSVARACAVIIRSHVQPYDPLFTVGEGDPRSRPRRPNYWQHRLDDVKSAHAWWDTRRDKTMKDLQIEALEWVIQEEVKSPRDYSKAERKHLEETLRKVRASRDGLKPSWPFDK